MRVALEAGVLPGLEAFSTIGRTGDDRVIVKLSRADESDQIAFGRLVNRSLVEENLGVLCDRAGLLPGHSLISRNHQMD